MSLIIQYGNVGPWSNTFQRTGHWSAEGGNIGGAAWPTANKAFLYPFHLDDSAIFDGAVWHNGGVAAGSSDFGIYHPNGTLLGSVGGASNTGVSTSDTALFDSEVALTPGVYYAAISCDNTSQFFLRVNATVTWQALYGIKEATNAYPLPSTIAMVTVSASYIPFFAIRRKSI